MASYLQVMAPFREDPADPEPEPEVRPRPSGPHPCPSCGTQVAEFRLIDQPGRPVVLMERASPPPVPGAPAETVLTQHECPTQLP